MGEVKGSDGEREKDDASSLDQPLSSGNNDGSANKSQPLHRRITGPARKSSKGKWTKEEDDILRDAVQRYNAKSWRRIAECVPGRTDVQCLHRWQKVLNPDLIKGAWTKEEDDLIIELVGKQGNGKWSEVAKHLPGRIGKQCRERWHNHLNPEINKTPWTKEEEEILIEAHSTYGNKWAEITKYLHGRTENAIKNHWNCSVKKKLDHYLARGLPLTRSGISNPGSFSYKIEPGGRKNMAAKQSPGIAFSVEEKMDSEKNTDSSFLDLVLGYSNERMMQVKSSRDGIFRNLHGGTTISKELPSQMHRPNQLCRHRINNTQVSRSSDHVTSKQLNASLSTAFGNYAYSSCSGCLINSLPQRPSSEYLQPHVDSSGKVRGDSTNTPTSSRKEHLPVNTEKLLDSPEGKHSSAPPRDNLSTTCSCFSAQSNSCFSIKPTCRGIDENNDTRMQQRLVDKSFAGLCYEPLQREDLEISVSSGKFPSTYSYIRQPLSPVPVSPSKVREVSLPVSSSSPESILRRAAVNFNLPSIMRKRGLRNSQKIESVNHTGEIMVHKRITESSNSRLQTAPNSPCLDDQVQCTGQILLSPPKSRKLENSDAIRCVGKRLENAFDDAWDSGNFNSTTSPIVDFSGVKCDLEGSSDATGA